MKMLAGSFDDYTGEIVIGGQLALLHSPTLAKRHGIGMIYQELSLARPISITENLLAGRLPRRGPFLDKARARAQAKELLASVGLDLDPNLPIEDISQHEAQLVEIAKVLGNKPSILVMDEPTSALSHEEVERLFCIIGELKAPRHRHRLHLPPPSRDLPDRRPRHGHAGRKEDRDQARRRR